MMITPFYLPKEYVRRMLLSNQNRLNRLARSFGTIDNKDPGISSTYSVYGPSSSNQFSSTSFINYSPVDSFSNFDNRLNSYGNPLSYQSPGTSNYYKPPSTSYGTPILDSYPSTNHPYGPSTPISQHIEVTKP